MSQSSLEDSLFREHQEKARVIGEARVVGGVASEEVSVSAQQQGDGPVLPRYLWSDEDLSTSTQLGEGDKKKKIRMLRQATENVGRREKQQKSIYI
jgi:hypothetical protein